jgi:predicted Zn-dependent protease
MSKQLDWLVDLLHGSDAVDEFVAIEREGGVAELHHHAPARERAERAGPPRTRRSIDRRHIDLTLYRDVRRGRGSARLRVAGAMSRPDMARFVDQAARRAARSLEPAWSLPPPAAPARVDVADALLPRDLMGAALALQGQLDDLVGARSAGDRMELMLRGLRVDAARDRLTVRTSRGFVHVFDETMLSVTMVLAARDAGPVEPGVQPGVEITRVRGRRVADLDLGGAIVRAARHLNDRRRAEPTPPGRYDLVLSDSALTPDAVTEMSRGLHAWHEPERHASEQRSMGAAPGAAEYGWFGPLVAQADARMVREGLARYLPGQSIYRDKPDPSADFLTLASDGALPFGLLSQPVGAQGEPVRRFTLVERGVAAGLALDLREAALRGVTANGGVRNLHVAPGSTPEDALHQPGALPLLHAVALDWLEIDTRSGELVAALGLGYRQSGPGTATPVTGGVIRGNVFELWARARLAANEVRAGWYRGPGAVRFGDVRIS